MSVVNLGFTTASAVNEAFGTPTLKTARAISSDLGMNEETLQSAEVPTRNQTAAYISTGFRSGGSVSSELQYPNETGNWMQLLLESVMRSDFVHTDLTAGSAVTCTMDASGKTVTADAGTPFGNIAVGHWLYVKSALNDWFAKVTAVTSSVITFGGATVVDETSASTQIAGSYIENADTLKLLKAEQQSGNYFKQFVDLVTSQWSVNLTPRSLVQSNFTLLGGAVTASNTRVGTLAAAGNNDPLTTGDRMPPTYLLRNGSVDSDFNLTSFSFTVNANPQEKPVLTQDGVYGFDNGTLACDGSMELWTNQKDYFDIVKGGTFQTVAFAIQDTADNFILFEFPAMKFSSISDPAQGGTEAFKSTIGFNCASTSGPLIKLAFVPKLS